LNPAAAIASTAAARASAFSSTTSIVGSGKASWAIKCTSTGVVTAMKHGCCGATISTCAMLPNGEQRRAKDPGLMARRWHHRQGLRLMPS
jgi:hypothetical protein